MRTKRRGAKAFFAAGIVLLAAAVALIGCNLWDAWQAGETSSRVLTELEQQMPQPADEDSTESGVLGQATPGNAVEIPDYVLNPDMEMPTLEIEGRAYIGVLEIPALGLSLPVLSEWSYPNLRAAPCRYSGSAYAGNFVIAGHNYRAHFGTLRELLPGDEVTFTDVDGNRFSYAVAELEVLQPTDLDVLLEDGWDLTLFTCTPSGQARVTVRCTAQNF